MPIHDWTQVTAAAFHHFHQTWLIEGSAPCQGGSRSLRHQGKFNRHPTFVQSQGCRGH